MIATIISERKKHYPVLLSEIISIITPQYGGTFIDCTLGQGGYSKKILEFANTKIIALDRDKDTKKIIRSAQSIIAGDIFSLQTSDGTLDAEKIA